MPFIESFISLFSKSYPPAEPASVFSNVSTPAVVIGVIHVAQGLFSQLMTQNHQAVAAGQCPHYNKVYELATFCSVPLSFGSLLYLMQDVEKEGVAGALSVVLVPLQAYHIYGLLDSFWKARDKGLSRQVAENEEFPKIQQETASLQRVVQEIKELLQTPQSPSPSSLVPAVVGVEISKVGPVAPVEPEHAVRALPLSVRSMNDAVQMVLKEMNLIKSLCQAKIHDTQTVVKQQAEELVTLAKLLDEERRNAEGVRQKQAEELATLAKLLDEERRNLEDVRGKNEELQQENQTLQKKALLVDSIAAMIK